jgi:hypothetical protein
MRVKEITLNEVANNPYDYELDQDGAQFIDKDGNSYSIKFMRIESGVFAVAFSSGIFVDQKTDRHDSFRIFATVIDAIKSYATKNEVAMIVFSANKSEPNRVNLYKKLALAFTRNSNYKLIEHSKEITDAALKDRIQYLFWYLKTKDFTPFMIVNRKFTNEQGVAESASGKTPSGYTWSFEPGDKVPWKSEVEVNTFIRVKDDKGKTVLGVWADVYNDTVEVQYSEVFDKKLRSKGIYTDFLKGLSKYYNIISDQDNNNAAREIYKKLGAAYDHKTEKHTLSRPNQGVAEDSDQKNTNDLYEKWSQKYKRSINCNNPKGFSQRAHCQGRKKNEDTIVERKRKRSKKKAAYTGYGYYPAYVGSDNGAADGGGGG